MMKEALVLLLLGMSQELVASTGVESMEHLIPSNNWYSPPLYPKTNPSDKLIYDDMQCRLIEGCLASVLQNQGRIGRMTEEEVSKSKTSFQSCQGAVCGDSFIRTKFSDDDTMTELFMLMITRGKYFPDETGYEVFAYLVDPQFRKFIKDIPYPLIDLEDFDEQAEAASKIIEKVCDGRPREENIDVGVVSQIFIDILVDQYIQNAFIASEIDELVAERNPDRIEALWKVAAGHRARDACFDVNRFYSLEERTTAARVRKTAQKLGVECGLAVSESSSLLPTTTPPTAASTEFKFESGGFELGAPPSGPSGGFGPAPGDSSSERSGGAPSAPSGFPSGPPI